MKTDTFKFLGLAVALSVPTTNEEFDKAAGEINAACAFAVDQYMFHTYGGKFREAFCLAVEKDTGIAWPKDEDAMKTATPKKDGSVSDIHISHGAYFKQVLAQTGRTVESFADVAAAVVATLPFDPSASSTGGRIGKEFTTAAEQVIEKGPEALANVIATLNRLNPGLNVGENPSVDDLARAIKANAERKKKEANAELGLA